MYYIQVMQHNNARNMHVYLSFQAIILGVLRKTPHLKTTNVSNANSYKVDVVTRIFFN